MYNNWVQKLATKEYADELVILACAVELRVKLACVPFTPFRGAPRVKRSVGSTGPAASAWRAGKKPMRFWSASKME